MPTGRELVLGTLFKGRLSPEFTKAIRELKMGLQELNAILGHTERKARGTAASMERMGRSAGKVDRAMGTTTKSTELMNKQIGKAKDGYTRFIGALKVTAAYSVAATAMFTLTRALRGGIDEIIDYDQALKNIQAITGSTASEVQAMGGVILDVAKKTKFSTTEIADGMVLLGQSGFTAEESMQAIRAAANLASGTLSDMRNVTDLLTTTIRAFNLSAIESGRVSDVMANAVNRSKLTVDKLRIAFNFVGASAAQAGLSIEETAATMMTLANNGLRASTIGTGFRQVLAKMIAPSAKLREIMEGYGIELASINPVVVGFEKALENLSRILIDSETGLVDMTKAFDLFKLRGAQAAAIIAKSFLSGQWQKALSEAERVGTAAEMAKIQLEGLAAELKNVRDRAGVLATRLGDAGLKGIIEGVVTVARTLLEVLDHLATTVFGRLIVKMTALIAIAGALRLAFIGIKAVLAAISFKAILLNPITLGVVAIAGLVAAIVEWSGATERARKEHERLAAEAIATSASLDLYRRSLEALHKSTNSKAPREYNNLLKRLVIEHKGLAREIDLTKLSHEELIGTLEKFQAIELRKAMEDNAKAVSSYKEEVDRINETYVWWKKNTELLAKATEEKGVPAIDKINTSLKFFLEHNKAAAEAVKGLNDSVEKQLQLYAKGLISGGKTFDQTKKLGEAFIDASVPIKSLAEDIKTWYNNLLASINRTFLEIENKTLPLFSSLRTAYVSMYNDLDLLSKVDLSKFVTRTDKKIAAFKKVAEGFITDEKKLSVAIEAERQKDMVNFLFKLEEEKKQEKLSSIEKEDILNEFGIRVVDEYDKRVKAHKERMDAILEDESLTHDQIIQAKKEFFKVLEKEEKDHGIRLLAFDELRNKMRVILDNQYLKESDKQREKLLQGTERMHNQLLALEKKFNDDLTREQKRQIEEHILEKKRGMTKLNLVDELAVAQGKITQDEADKNKRRREIEFLKFIIEMREKAVQQSLITYRMDSENYKIAINAKKKAEADLFDARLRHKIDDAEASKKAKEDAEKAKEKIEELGETYKRVSVTIKNAPIVIDADITPAKAAMDALTKFYKERIAQLLVQYVEMMRTTDNILTGTSAVVARNTLTIITNKIRDYTSSLSGLGDTLKRITGIQIPAFAAPEARGLRTSGAPSVPTRTGATATSGTTRPVETINLNITLPSGRTSTLQVVNAPGARSTVQQIGTELEKMGLSHV